VGTALGCTGALALGFRLHPRSRRRLADDHSVEEDRPFVEVDGVWRQYAGVKTLRIHRMLAIFGGLGADQLASRGDDEDEDEEDEDEYNDDEKLARRLDGFVALEDVSFTAHAGTCTVVAGQKNSGKSVLLKIMAGAIPPSRGRVVVHGSAAPVVDAYFAGFPRWGTVEAAIKTVAGLCDVPVRRVRRNMDEIFELIGNPALRKERVNLAGGATRRLAMLATMLTLDPDVLFIDIELSGKVIGPQIRERLLELKASGAVIVIASRRPERLAWLADRVLTLENGKLVRDEKIDEALARIEREAVAEPGPPPAQQVSA
jgi:ABC-type multidrug transport system ATPase subunit